MWEHTRIAIGGVIGERGGIEDYYFKVTGVDWLDRQVGLSSTTDNYPLVCRPIDSNYPQPYFILLYCSGNVRFFKEKVTVYEISRLLSPASV